MPYGRGGAGNIQAFAEQQPQPSSQKSSEVDLEANRQPTTPTAEPSQSYSEQQQQKEYAHTGRGGAGNWYSPRELSEKGNFHDSNLHTAAGRSASGSSLSAAGDAGSARPLGRGGAGNYYGYGADSEVRASLRRREEEAKRERLYEDIERGVEETLAMPQRARLAGGAGAVD
ncbi:hypothetical protein K431DRAFT_306207 [Polychaeton citri CBS 116435]|uniref:Uncharacterized protein n=1 Tax=Polychaeton citri CBS 116435 TaxID=1314669 RepID=A0A9P4UMF3_9PEZI|nr:hypothetical protein K431DRAFT_306207 [Polychaeton citri CBS 116435]